MPRLTVKSANRRCTCLTSFVPVQIVAEPIQGLTVIAPSGIRIEGLSVEQVITILEAVER